MVQLKQFKYVGKDIDDFILKGDGMTAWWDNMEEYGYYNGALGPELYDELHRAQVLPTHELHRVCKNGAVD